MSLRHLELTAGLPTFQNCVAGLIDPVNLKWCRYGWEELEETGCVAWALEQQYWYDDTSPSLLPCFSRAKGSVDTEYDNGWIVGRQSGDDNWLKSSTPALLKIAQFFASRTTRCAPPRNTSLFCLNHVMVRRFPRLASLCSDQSLDSFLPLLFAQGPDESHAPVNNSGFTSGVRLRCHSLGSQTYAMTPHPAPYAFRSPPHPSLQVFVPPLSQGRQSLRTGARLRETSTSRLTRSYGTTLNSRASHRAPSCGR